MANDFKNAQNVGVTTLETVYTAPASKDSILQVISGQKIILLTGDYICVTASGACDVVCSILEDVNS